MSRNRADSGDAAPEHPIKSARRVRYRGLAGEGQMSLDQAASHKVRSVLRLGPADLVALIDDAGHMTPCRIIEAAETVTVESIGAPRSGSGLFPFAVAAPLLKNERMDWMIEKLCECHCAEIVPFVADRSTIRAPGRERVSRWRRIAEAAALQSGSGLETTVLDPVDRIDDLVPLSSSWYFDAGGLPIADAGSIEPPEIILVGPEGGWSERERGLLAERSKCISLGKPVFRAETAAILAAFSTSQLFQYHKRQ